MAYLPNLRVPDELYSAQAWANRSQAQLPYGAANLYDGKVGRIHLPL